MSKLTYATIYSEGLPEAEARAFEQHLAALRESDPRACPHRIAGAELHDGAPLQRHDPSQKSRVVSTAASADKAVLDRAIAEARRAQPSWRALDPEGRAAIIEATVPRLRFRREELAALLSLEVGKARTDAIAEVDECVAIVELAVAEYRRSGGFAAPLEAPAGAKSAGVAFRPYGVFAAIAPFNFPLAIPFAMLTGALLTGNTVVFKPSAYTPACGDEVFQLFMGAGVPDGVLTLVQGDGETGALLADAPVDGVVFTGSAEVGLALVRRLTQPPFVRPVIAEMGGKNPGIVSDAAADIEVAARAVARAAFGMSGQKCNACSRAVVLDGVYDEFIDALVAEVARFEVGDPASGTAFTGPVVTERAAERFERAVALARKDGRVLTGGGSALEDGHYAELTVIDGLEPGHELTREELFVPVLSVVRVPDFDAAIAEANTIRYGLAAGIFSRDPGEVERFLDEIEAGIVFVNNPGGATTGVWPGNQTMPGWKGSGTTGKGGFGPYYLQQFVREQSRTIFP